MKPGWSSHLAVGATAGLLLLWLLPGLIGPPVVTYAPELRAQPRLSDGVAGAGGLMIYISQAPEFYVGTHLKRSPSHPGLLNAIGWILVGLTAGGFIAGVRMARQSTGRRQMLTLGATSGLLFGWIFPALSLALGEAFRHCWMHEGFLGSMALVGGGAMRTTGVLAELPWRLLAGTPEGITPVLAIPVSAAAWTLAGVACAIGLSALRLRLMAGRSET